LVPVSKPVGSLVAFSDLAVWVLQDREQLGDLCSVLLVGCFYLELVEGDLDRVGFLLDGFLSEVSLGLLELLELGPAHLFYFKL